MFDVTKDASYILKMHLSATDDEEDIRDGTIKTLEAMLASPVGWRRGDMLQVIRNYYRVGLFAEGDAVEAYFRRTSPDTFLNPYDERDEGTHLSTKYYYEDKWHRYEEFRKLKEKFPDLAPNTATVYSSNRTKQTKSYLKLRAAAEESGFVFEPFEPYHFCRRKACRVQFISKHDLLDQRHPVWEYIECEIHARKDCDGHDEYGNLCIFPCMGSRPLHWKLNIRITPKLSDAILLVHSHGSADVSYLQRIMGISERQAIDLQRKMLRLGIIENRYNSGHYGPRQILEKTIMKYADIR